MRRALALGAAMALCALAAPAQSSAQSGCNLVVEQGEDLQTEVNNLQAGQTLCLRGVGHFKQNVDVLPPRDNVTLQSVPGERATWRGRIRIAASGVRVQNLNLDGTVGPPCVGCHPGTVQPSLVINGPNTRINDNDIRNSKGICVHPNISGTTQPLNFVIERNRIHNCRPRSNKIHGVYIAYARGGTVQDNVIYDNGDKGVMLYPDARNVTVRRNIIDGNATGVHFAGDASTASRDNTVENNIVSNSNPRANVESHWAGPVGTNNRFINNCVSAHENTLFPELNGIYLANGGFSPDGNHQAAPPYHGRARKDFRIFNTGYQCYGMQPPSSVAVERADQAPTERTGIRTTCGQFLATDVSIQDEIWYELTGCGSAARVAVSDSLVAQISAGSGQFASKFGGLNQDWFVHTPDNGVKVALAGQRLAITNGCGDIVSKDTQFSGFEVEAQCGTQFITKEVALAGDRVGSLSACPGQPHGAFRVKDTPGGPWVDESFCNQTKAIALTTSPTRLAQLTSCGQVAVKEGPANANWMLTTPCTEGVTAFDITGDRIAWVNGCGAVRTQEGFLVNYDDPLKDDKAPWAIERGCGPMPKAVQVSAHRLAIITNDNKLLVKEGGSGAAWRQPFAGDVAEVSIPED